jgi:hypothetical protein
MDKMPFKFTGVLNKVVVELGKSGLTAEDQKKLKARTDEAEAAFQ